MGVVWGPSLHALPKTLPALIVVRRRVPQRRHRPLANATRDLFHEQKVSPTAEAVDLSITVVGNAVKVRRALALVAFGTDDCGKVGKWDADLWGRWGLGRGHTPDR